MTLAIVVLSGGLDSTVCAALAAREADAFLALSFDYGQTHRVELAAAAAVATHYGAEHLVVELDLRQWGGSALTDAAVDIPPPATSSGDIPATYVPARNLIFLSVAAGVAEARGADTIYLGVNAIDYSGYPDCRPEFIESFEHTAALALKRGVEGNALAVVTPLIALTKGEIVRLGVTVDAPLHLSWSCYRGGDRPCGRCDSCDLRAKGFAAAGLADPAVTSAR